MSPTALITGATGFLGRAVVVAFERQQWNVVGTGLSRAEPPLRKLDLQQVDSIAAALDEIQYVNHVYRMVEMALICV